LLEQKFLVQNWLENDVRTKVAIANLFRAIFLEENLSENKFLEQKLFKQKLLEQNLLEKSLSKVVGE
jgi:hypothetical protein